MCVMSEGAVGVSLVQYLYVSTYVVSTCLCSVQSQCSLATIKGKNADVTAELNRVCEDCLLKQDGYVTAS